MNPFQILKNIEDPRINRTKLHSLDSIIFTTISAVVSGAETWVDIADFGKAKQNWLEKFVDLPNGTASHDTIGDLFQRINPKEFEQAFIQWTSSVCGITEGELIAIDGKRLRGSYDKTDKKAAIHMISAWACENELVLGQEKTDKKSNEITAIPKLL